MNKIFILIAGIFFVTTTPPSSASVSSEGIITDGETLTYVASYKMAGMLTDIAEIKMETSKVKTKTNEFYRLKCTAATYSKWDSWFRVRDLYESYINTKSFKPVLFNRDIEEGNYKKKVKYKFKHSKGIAKTTITKRRGDGTDWVRNFDTKIQSNTLDIVSALYKVRTFDIENYTVGKVIPINLLIDGELMKAYLKFRGKESLEMGKFGNKECYKIALSFAEGTFDKAKGSKVLWITADSKRLIALIKAKIPLGTVQIRLSDIN